MYQEGIGYREASEKEIEGELLQLINRAVRNSTISFRREIKEHIRPSVKAPSSLKLGHWMPPKIGQFDPENTLRSEYYQLERDFPSREMLATPAGLIHLPTVNLECPEYLPISPNWFGSVTTEVSIEPYAQCPGWHAHLDRVFGTDESGIQNREALQDWFGYLLMPHARLNKFCILHGASQSGKSTCLRVLMALVKSETISAAQLGQQFGLSELVGITHAAIDEMKIDKNWFQSTATARLLSVTGGMQTPIEIKFQQSVNTHPALKFTMTANAMPGFDNSHDAITNRIHPIYFARTIPVGDRRNGIEQEWIQRELSGILAWAIEGYQRVFSQNRLSLPGSLEESIAQLNQETDPIAEFMGESITQVRSQIATLRISDLFDAYRGYCSEVNVRAITRRALEQLITTRYGISVTIPSNHHHVRAREIRGYALTPEGNGYRSAYIVKKNQ